LPIELHHKIAKKEKKLIKIIFSQKFMSILNHEIDSRGGSSTLISMFKTMLEVGRAYCQIKKVGI
jgi:hypothetical protein